MKKQSHPPLWVPSEKRCHESQVWKFIEQINAEYDQNLGSFEELRLWSIQNPDIFWRHVAKFGNINLEFNNTPTNIDSDNMWEQHFFPNATLNYAENLLKKRTKETAIIFTAEDKVRHEISYLELFTKTAQLAKALLANGIQPGDCVAGFVSNTPDALIAMLATTAVGGVWASGSPDFGSDGAIDRFGQIEPKFLFATNGYYYNGKAVQVMNKVAEISKRLPSLKHTIICEYLPTDKNTPNSSFISLSKFIQGHTSDQFAFPQFPFNHPLFIMFSSGTTGKPKCIVHGAGGTLLQHVKEHQLHMDIHPKDRMFYFTTCGWMMWNWLVTGLASQATLILFDGSPFAKKGRILIDLIEREKITMFGVSAKYIDAIAKLKLSPKDTHDLSSLRSIGSTGSPLSHESFEYVYSNIKQDVQLSSLSGGTDIVSCFAIGNPIGPVYRGQLQSRGLGMDVDVFDPKGNSVKNQKGDLVCKQPFPCMPVYFWKDTNHQKYRAAYFERFNNIWCHGDYVELTDENGVIFHGRSDAVLNPGGVRIGTAEIYRQVEKVDEILECFAVGQQYEGDERVVLFVKLRPNHPLSSNLIDKIQTTILENTTRRHVPSIIIAVPDIPKTRSGKIVEIAVRELIHGGHIKNIESIINPESLAFYQNISELQ